MYMYTHIIYISRYEGRWGEEGEGREGANLLW